MKKSLFFLVISLIFTVMVFAGAGGQKDDTSTSQKTISFLRPRNSVIDGHELIFDAIEKKYRIRTEIEVHVGGIEGENIIKTRLAVGEMADVFLSNIGSKINDINPDRNCLDLTSLFASRLEPIYVASASVGGNLYAVPWDYNAYGGAIWYSKKIYQILGLQIPKTWNEFLANCDVAQAAGYTALLATYRDTYTSQLIVLIDNYYIKRAMPDWPQQYTANKAKYSTIPIALRSFEKLAETAKYLNRDYLSTTLMQGLKKIAEGEVTHFAIQAHRLPILNLDYPEAVDDIGIFALPGDDPNHQGITVWLPNGLYINSNSKKINAAKQWLDFILTQEAYDMYSSLMRPVGPLMVKGIRISSATFPGVMDLLKYIDSGRFEPALEFESPVKGPNLEQLCIEVTTGRMTPMQAAVAYDQDVEKQAILLNLPGW